MKDQQRAMLVILDGWGIGAQDQTDAIWAAHTPTMDRLMAQHPHSTLTTFGEDVGLPAGQMGNSEVGHLNIGAGRVVYQELARINKAVKDKTLDTIPVLQDVLTQCSSTSGRLHLMGLVSDGGVHSHLDHIAALAQIAQAAGVKEIYIHAFMDGRDTDPRGGADYISDLQSKLKGTDAKIASVIGRYYAMDRDKRWERTKLAYDLLVHRIGESAADPIEAIKSQYAADITDEFLPAIKIKGAFSPIREGDTVLFANFRTDRPRQLTHVLTQANMPEFEMQKLKLHYATMTRYDESFDGLHVIFEKDNIEKTIGEVIAENGLTQLRAAETEKYPHVTFFLNGGREEAFEGEDRLMEPSPKVATYDLQPEMSAIPLTNGVIKKIETQQPNFICLNYANTDMVGHTGVFEAAKKAAQTVDSCLAALLNAAQEFNYEIIIIADHGNADKLVNPDGSPNTAHTVNPVPCVHVGSRNIELKNGRLADIAPTLLDLLDVKPPAEMSGCSLLKKN